MPGIGSMKLMEHREKDAEREIYESRILIDFLMVYGLDTNVLGNYKTSMVKIALAWKDGSLTEQGIERELARIQERIMYHRKKATAKKKAAKAE